MHLPQPWTHNVKTPTTRVTTHRNRSVRAVTARDLIDTAFSYTNLYINYRAKFIAIKAEGARRKDSMAQEVVKLFETNGYGVVTTPQGMIVRIDR
jgi:hypothetical protein